MELHIDDLIAGKIDQLPHHHEMRYPDVYQDHHYESSLSSLKQLHHIIILKIYHKKEIDDEMAKFVRSDISWSIFDNISIWDYFGDNFLKDYMHTISAYSEEKMKNITSRSTYNFLLFNLLNTEFYDQILDRFIGHYKYINDPYFLVINLLIYSVSIFYTGGSDKNKLHKYVNTLIKYIKIYDFDIYKTDAIAEKNPELNMIDFEKTFRISKQIPEDEDIIDKIIRQGKNSNLDEMIFLANSFHKLSEEKRQETWSLMKSWFNERQLYNIIKSSTCLELLNFAFVDCDIVEMYHKYHDVTKKLSFEFVKKVMTIKKDNAPFLFISIILNCDKVYLNRMLPHGMLTKKIVLVLFQGIEVMSGI